MVRTKTDKVFYLFKNAVAFRVYMRLCRWIYEHWAALEQYFKVKTKTLQEKHVPAPHCPNKIPPTMVWDRIWASRWSTAE